MNYKKKKQPAKRVPINKTRITMSTGKLYVQNTIACSEEEAIMVQDTIGLIMKQAAQRGLLVELNHHYVSSSLGVKSCLTISVDDKFNAIEDIVALSCIVTALHHSVIQQCMCEKCSLNVIRDLAPYALPKPTNSKPA